VGAVNKQNKRRVARARGRKIFIETRANPFDCQKGDGPYDFADMKWFSALAAAGLVAVAPLVHAIGPDEDYISIYQMIEDADQLMANNQVAGARAKFKAAEEALKKFKATYPTWNAPTVDFRLRYVTEKVATLTPAAPATAAPTPAAGPNATSAPAVTRPAATDPTAELRQTVAQLQEQNKVLNAKLQEALAAQPAAVDPRELQKAESQINALQKERDLLKVALEQEQAKVAKAADKSGLEAAQKEIASLRAQMAAAAAPGAASAAAAERELAGAREAARTNALAVTALQVALKDMREERDAVLSRAAAASARQESGNSKDAEKKVKELERERDDLSRRLSLANRELAESKSKGNPNRDENSRIAVLRARLEALEARKVPYTPEELAAMKPGTANPRAVPETRKEAKRKELPAGAGIIIQDAQRAFAAKRFEEAEQKYLQVLKMDDQNVFTLGNLGLIQMEAGRLNDAEATLTKANSIDPTDAFVLSQLGILRFRQQKVDEAVDLLSRAIELDPRNAEAQNYLGIALSEKGLRGPAETALRKAIELNPNYAVAHHNLAVVYASQQPPFIELARYHYNKSRDLGHPADVAIENMLKKAKP
jgi:tetratricopeptide (TPR) repeat protein